LCTGTLRPALVISGWIADTCPSGEMIEEVQPLPVAGPVNIDVSITTLVGAVPLRASLTCAASLSSRAAPGNWPLALTESVGSPPPIRTTSPGSVPATARVASR
jgi:hypothetical protein